MTDREARRDPGDSRCRTPRSAGAPILSWIRSQGFDAARAQVRAILDAVATMPKRRADSRDDELPTAERPHWEARCARSCSTPKRPGSIPIRAHRLVEIGCIELVNRIPSGKAFHRYLNPERDVPAEAFAVHGLSVEFLEDKPLFAEIVEELIAFIGDAPLVAHNAMFDLGFLNAELERAGKDAGRARAPGRYADAGAPQASGGPNRLDDLCARYGIDNSRRTKHGALLDAETAGGGLSSS